MMYVVRPLLGLSVVLLFLPGEVVMERRETDPLWLFEKPGDIILHGLFPIRKNTGEVFALNFEGVAWMGAMIHRIDRINHEKLLPGNLTLGYAIRDTLGETKTGLRHTLSVLNEILNTDRGKHNKALRQNIPIVLGPATDELVEASQKLYHLFKIPRVAYTTTSSRFEYNEFERNTIRTVPTDIIHIEALLRLLSDMNALEVSVISSSSSPWQERMNLFQAALKETKGRIEVKELIQMNAVESLNISALHQRVSSKVVIVFAESNISRSIIREEKDLKLHRKWIQVCEFDDPLLRVFDTFGKLTKKVIVRGINARSNAVDEYRREITKTLFSNDAGKVIKPDWLSSVFVKHCSETKLSSHNESNVGKECMGFLRRITSAIGSQNDNSSLTLQGIINAVDLIISSVTDTLEQCGASTPRLCLKLSTPALFGKLKRAVKVRSQDFDIDDYSIQVLRLVKDGRRTKMQRDRTFRKVRDWRIRRLDIQDKLRLYWQNLLLNNLTYPSTSISITTDSDQIIGFMNLSHNYSCVYCSGLMDQSDCVPDNGIVNWTDSWAITLYFPVCLCLLAVLSTFVYFSQHKNSPIMILCYSWPDNIILAVLCLFSLLPMMHIGLMASQRCFTLWPIINVIFASYSGLLLTKTLFLQNLLKCEVATERPGRRIAFAMMITLIQVFILASLFVFDYPKTTHLACTSRGTVTLCNIEENIGILVSMAFNLLLFCLLFALSLVETLKQRQNFCRTENLVAVATVALLSYACLSVLAYFNVRLEHHLAVALIQSVIYLVNSAVCLGLIYIPTLRLVSTWLRQHIRQQKNLTSIKRAQVMSSKRQASVPIRESLFGANFSTEQLALPSGRHSGYYFDLRPASAVTDMSYPTSLVRSVHEHSHVVFGYGRRGPMSVNEATSMESVPSMDWLDAPSQAHSASSSYDNLSQAAEETADDLSPQELLHEISTYWERHRSSDVIANGQLEENIETNKWPSLQHLRTSDL